MLFAVVTSSVSFEAQPPGESEVLEGISRAFFAALDRDVTGFEIVVWGALVLAAGVVVLGWRRDAQREQHERRELEVRRVRMASQAPARHERREWLRVPANVSMMVAQGAALRASEGEMLETNDLGGGGLSFLSERAPRRGARLRFTLDLGERRPLVVRGTVVRVAPPRQPGAPSLVGVKFGEVDYATQERLVRWVLEEARREILEARRGRLCGGCERPLADGTESMHPTCAARVEIKQAA